MENGVQQKLAFFLSDVMSKEETLEEFNSEEIIVDNTIHYDGENGERIIEFRVTVEGKLFDIIVKEV